MRTKHFLFIACLLAGLYVQAQIPILNSKPWITNKVIYLDFDGQVVSATGWNSGNTINALPSTISNNNKISVFQRMCEDYTPFDVNVTTDSMRFNNAMPNRRIRVVITPTSAWYTSPAGGVAFVGSFNWGGTPGTPCWIFENQLGYSAKNIAEACAHEVGHTLTLRHQSTYDASCNKTAEYNPGLGTGVTSWAPIMGVGYSKNVTIWHTGTSATACNLIQYDHSNSGIGITSPNYLTFLPDDVGDTYPTAKTLNLITQTTRDLGVIATTADVDAFQFTICNNRYVSVAVKPWALDTVNYTGADLDIRLALFNSSGTQLAIDTPLTKLQGLVGANLTPGSYYFTIDGGRSSNYTDYGSLGKYFISVKATNPPQLANTIVTPNNMCAGQTLTLGATSNGTPTNWQWTVNGPAGSSNYTAQSPSHAFGTAGVYTLSLLATSASSLSCEVTTTINVGNLPTLSASSTSYICNNQTATLTASGAASYIWLNNNASGNTQIVSPVSTTNYTLIGSNGLCSTTAITTVTVGPAPVLSVIATPTALCFGQSGTLTISGASSYYTFPGNTTSNIISIMPGSSTTYTISGTTGACTSKVTKLINVVPDFTVAVVASRDFICLGESTTLSFSGANTYTLVQTNMSGNNIIVTPTTSLYYNVLGATNPLCINSADLFIDVSACTGLKTNAPSIAETLNVFPNPSSDKVTVELANGCTLLQITDAAGKIIFSKNINAQTVLDVDVHAFAKGLYTVRATFNNKPLVIQKLVIE